MTDFFTNVGDSLRVAGQQRRLMQEQYFQGNNTGSIKDSIFTRKAEVQQSNNGNSYDTMGLLNEPFSVPSGQVQQAKTQTEAVPAESRAIQESGSHTEERGAVQEATVAEETPTPAPAVERKTVQKTPASQNTEVTESPKSAGGLHSPVELSDALTEEEVRDELHEKFVERGGKRTPSLPGEISEGDWSIPMNQDDAEMVCRDSSGRTQDIRGRLKVLSDDFEKNPEAFTITDNSSGSDHKYLYRKAGVNDKGQPVYKCVSMNGNPITTDNQYTLQWTEDGSPELVQYSDQDNYGIGLRVGQKDNTDTAADTLGDDGAYETAPPDDYKPDAPDTSADSLGDDGPYQTAPSDTQPGKAVVIDDDGPYDTELPEDYSVGNPDSPNLSEDVPVNYRDIIDEAGPIRYRIPEEGMYDIPIGNGNNIGMPEDSTRVGTDEQIGDIGAEQPAETQAEIWINKMPTTQQFEKSLSDIKQEVIAKCNDSSRPLSDAEKRAINNCNSEQEVMQYLRSIGINVKYAV